MTQLGLGEKWDERNNRLTIKNLNDQQSTLILLYKIRSRNTFNKITLTNIRLLMRNEVNIWE